MKFRIILCAMVALVSSMIFGSSKVMAEGLTFDQPLSGWTVDRQAPGGFSINSTVFPGNNVLDEYIDGSQVQTNSFYNYQGMAHSFALTGASQTYSIDLYNDSNWSGMTINAGFWGVGTDSTNTISAYPIIAYRQSSTDVYAAGFYSFDYEVTGNWNYLGAAQAGWNNISFTLDTGVGVTYSVNGVALGATVDPSTTNLNSIILNDYNSGVSYHTYWDNFTATAAPLPSSAMAGLGLLGVLALGGVLRHWRNRRVFCKA